MSDALFPTRTSPRPGQVERYFKDQFTCLMGVDEAGRGALCGPVAAAAVVLPPRCRIPGLNDSKQLSAAARTELAVVVKERALAWAVGSASVAEIEEVNILQATFRAMNRAIDAAVTRLGHPPELVLVDGPHAIARCALPQKPIVRGDARSVNIAAASILAKTTRDAWMVALHQEHPGYGLDRHMGYGTRAHRDALQRLGLSPAHRRSFCHL